MAHLVIAGAGAAGLFAAGQALAAGHRVTVAEHMDRPGKKLAITGKGRCNLTCDCGVDDFLKGVRRNPKFLYSAANALPPHAAMRFFSETLGVPLKTERGRRVFPQSDDAGEVVAALVRHAAGATMVRGRAAHVMVENGRAAGLALEDGRRIEADAVLLATGGLSYPATGSTGAGYAMAKEAGHAVVPPRPSLVALVEKGDVAGRMAGLALRNVGLRLLQDGRCVFEDLGEMLFTHFGLSGPMVLSASAFVGDVHKHRYAVAIDLKPGLSAEKLDARIQRDFAKMANRDAANSLDKLLPNSMRGVMLGIWGVSPSKKVNQVTREERARLVALIKDFRIEVGGLGDVQHAVVTAGGVDVREVDPKTMQSRLVPRLYFAGEVLDVDGYTGGFNLHIAWCTAFAAANSI